MTGWCSVQALQSRGCLLRSERSERLCGVKGVGRVIGAPRLSVTDPCFGGFSLFPAWRPCRSLAPLTVVQSASVPNLSDYGSRREVPRRKKLPQPQVTHSPTVPHPPPLSCALIGTNATQTHEAPDRTLVARRSSLVTLEPASPILE